MYRSVFMNHSQISPHRLMAALTAAREALAVLQPDDDEVIRVDTIEGQSDALEVLDSIAAHVVADEALAERARERAKRLESRADRRREVIVTMLDALGLSKIERALYSASLSHQAKAQITDAAMLPPEFMRTAPDAVKIGKALR